jgi:hypothetical protein
MSGQRHAPAALPPGKEPRVGRTPEPIWTTWEEKILILPRTRTPISQSSSRYTDCSSPATLLNLHIRLTNNTLISSLLHVYLFSFSNLFSKNFNLDYIETLL